MAYQYTSDTFRVESDKVVYGPNDIQANYTYESSEVIRGEDGKPMIVRPKSTEYVFKTETKVPKTGVLFVGLGGNNGTTVTGGILAHKLGLKWNTKEAEHKPDFLGSITQASTCKLGVDGEGNDIFVPMKNMVPLLDPTNLVIGGWDISSMPLGDAMRRSGVFDYDLQRQLYPHMQKITPMPSMYVKDFIAANQEDRADNVKTGTMAEQMEQIRADIRNFKATNHLDKVIVLWTANTERFADIIEGVNDTADNLLAAIKKGHAEIAPSTVFAVATMLEHCTYINGSPQNTFVPGAVELAERLDVFIAGDDFKSGQTKMKSVMVDFLVSSGIKPVSIVSYNHLGNNDGKNLSAPAQFRSKEISKSNVVDDMVASNGIMFEKDEHPDHTVVIKYVPYVGDSKRAMDEYTSEIFMGGKNTIAMHNTCEDSLLAAPLILDLIVLGEFSERMTLKENVPGKEFEKMHSVLSLLSFLLKAPMVPPGTPVVNALFPQRQAICNIMRACVGLPVENYMLLENRTKEAGSLALAAARKNVLRKRTASEAALEESKLNEQRIKA